MRGFLCCELLHFTDEKTEVHKEQGMCSHTAKVQRFRKAGAYMPVPCSFHYSTQRASFLTRRGCRAWSSFPAAMRSVLRDYPSCKIRRKPWLYKYFPSSMISLCIFRFLNHIFKKSRKDKYHKISFICGIKKHNANELIYKT